MPAPSVNINHFTARLILDELKRQGVRHFIICPGSRSAPLAVQAAEMTGAEKTIWLDERGAGFHAIGIARATGRAAAVITTSGTAAANLFPAVQEAFEEELPLILLTADRPFEHIGIGANQTIRQRGMFASAVVHEADLNAPDETPRAGWILNQVGLAASKAGQGPVHINVAFREPLAETEKSFHPETDPQFESWLQDDKPWLSFHRGEKILRTLPAPVSGKILLVLEGLQEAESRFSEEIIRLAEEKNLVILADISSGCKHRKETIGRYDIFLGHASFCETLKPDFVLRAGHRAVSGRLGKALARWRVPTFHFSDRSGFSNPEGLRSSFLPLSALPDFMRVCSGDPGFREKWRQTEDRAEQKINGDTGKRIHQAMIASAITVEGGLIYAAASWPVRDLDRYFAREREFRVHANRGVSGIDGTLSAAAGLCRGSGRSVTAYLGDLSFLHDLSALAVLKNVTLPLKVIINDNNGGGIFRQLPISQAADFRRVFQTPHDLDLVSVIAGFGFEVSELTDEKSLKKFLRSKTDSVSFGVARTDPEEYMIRRKQLEAAFEND